MLKSKILAGSITNLTDARYFAAWEVEWMGFNLSEGEETFMAPAQVAAIKEWVEGPTIVGEFGLQTAEEIKQAIQDLDLDAIQLGMFSSLETLIELETNIPVIKELVVEKDMTREALNSLLQDFAPHVQYFLLDFEKNGWSMDDFNDGKEINLDFFKEDLAPTYSLILRINISAEEIETLIEDMPEVALKVQGGAEEKVGYKSFDELDEIFEALEELI